MFFLASRSTPGGQSEVASKKRLNLRMWTTNMRKMGSLSKNPVLKEAAAASQDPRLVLSSTFRLQLAISRSVGQAVSPLCCSSLIKNDGKCFSWGGRKKRRRKNPNIHHPPSLTEVGTSPLALENSSVKSPSVSERK